MLTIASCLSKEHEVYVFWNENLKLKAKEKLGIDLSRVKFTENIFKSALSTVKRIFKSREFDLVIYLSDGSIPFVAPKLIVHFQFPIEWVKVSQKTKLKLLKVNKIICNSKFTKSFIDKKFNVQSLVLYPPSEIKNIKTKKENIILHVGRFGTDIEGKNFKKQDVMINAFKKIKKMNNWRFVLVVGVLPNDQKKVNELKILAKGYPIDIVENPSNERLWQFYSKAKIYWHATGFGEDLKKHPEKAEHFGISTVEAMGAGAVPVVINAGGQREILQNNKNGFLWNTIDQLAQQTEKLMSDENLLNKMSKEAITRSKVFSQERFCKELKDLIWKI